MEPRGLTPEEAPEPAGTCPKVVVADQAEICVALYPYTSEEPGDLNFEVGETIEVIKKESEWWTGRIGNDRVGLFPFNYVEPVGGAEAAKAMTTSSVSDSDLL